MMDAIVYKPYTLDNLKWGASRGIRDYLSLSLSNTKHYATVQA